MESHAVPGHGMTLLGVKRRWIFTFRVARTRCSCHLVYSILFLFGEIVITTLVDRPTVIRRLPALLSRMVFIRSMVFALHLISPL